MDGAEFRARSTRLIIFSRELERELNERLHVDREFQVRANVDRERLDRLNRERLERELRDRLIVIV